MVTRRKRFSALKRVKRMSGPAAAYEAWDDQVGSRPRQPRPSGSRPGGYMRLQVQPFGAGGTSLIRVRVSNRAVLQVGTLFDDRAPEATADARVNSSFLPSKGIVFVGTGTAVDTTSNITGLSYAKRQGASFTHAFGGLTATEGEFEAQQAILTAALSVPNRSVSFSPERMFADI
jgi:hypothetical protein